GLRKHAAVDPASASSRAVVLQFREAADESRLSGARIDFIQPMTVYLHENLLEVWFPFDAARCAIGKTLLLVEVVVPGQVQERLVPGIRRVGVKLLQSFPEVVEKPRVGAAIAGWIDGLVVPLDEPLRVGQAAFLLRRRGRGDEEDLGLDIGRRRRL